MIFSSSKSWEAIIALSAIWWVPPLVFLLTKKGDVVQAVDSLINIISSLIVVLSAVVSFLLLRKKDKFLPDGTLPQSDSFITVEPKNMMVTLLKQVEDGDGLVLRAYKTIGAATPASIRLPKLERVIEADFGANEIKTFLMPWDTAKAITETNLLEWPNE